MLGLNTISFVELNFFVFEILIDELKYRSFQLLSRKQQLKSDQYI